MLRSLRLRDVGPAPSFDIEFSDRLNLLTGDNGLGKTQLCVLFPTGAVQVIKTEP